MTQYELYEVGCPVLSSGGSAPGSDDILQTITTYVGVWDEQPSEA